MATTPTRLTNDDWLAKATVVAMASARDLIKQAYADKGVIAAGTPIGRLSETEWGWIVAAIICGWVKTRADQAATEGSSINTIIHTTGQSPDPWDVGALQSVLPKLGTMALPWDQPIGGWSKEQMVGFLGQVHQLLEAAFAGRDKAARSHPAPNGGDVEQREMSAAVGGSLTKRGEMDDEIPF